MEKNENVVAENITINFDYFIQLAIQREIPWKSLAFMLTDLTTTLDRSKQIIRVLVKELEKWASRRNHQSNHKDMTDTVTTQGNVQIEDAEDTIEAFDDLVSGDESLNTDIEVETNELEEEINERIPDGAQNRFLKHEQRKTENDFPSNQFNEFIDSDEKPNSLSAEMIVNDKKLDSTVPMTLKYRFSQNDTKIHPNEV